MPSNEPEAAIPDDWRKPVLRILQNGRFGREIQTPKRVMEDWQADSLGAFPFEVRDPLIEALSLPGVIGKLEPNQPEPGITYAFWMFYQGRKFYAKICLFHDQVTLKLLSAHRPNKGEEHL